MPTAKTEQDLAVKKLPIRSGCVASLRAVRDACSACFPCRFESLTRRQVPVRFHHRSNVRLHVLENVPGICADGKQYIVAVGSTEIN